MLGSDEGVGEFEAMMELLFISEFNAVGVSNDVCVAKEDMDIDPFDVTVK